MIPNIFHFVFGMQADFGGKPFVLSHYLAVKSAYDTNKPDAIYFHYCYEPEGIWWEKTKNIVTLNKVEAPLEFMGQPILHFAHQADVIRLQMLDRFGGIYMDLDTISVQPMTNWLKHQFVIGEESSLPFTPKNKKQEIKYFLKTKLGLLKKQPAVNGFCNAVLLSEKQGEFVNIWMNAYKTFRSKGRDKYWNEHSVILPRQLYLQYPHLVTVAGPHTFHYPLYDAKGLASIFAEVHQFPEAYVHHLWESFSWEPYLSKLTEEYIIQVDTTYNIYARKFL